MTDRTEELTDPLLADVARSLDAWAAAERAAAPADLDARIAGATVALLRQPAPAPLPFPIRATAAGGVSRFALRMAAAVAIAATLGAVYMAQRTPRSATSTTVAANDPAAPTGSAQVAATDTTTPEEEALYALAGWNDDPSGDLQELRLAADQLGDSLNSSWTASSLGSDEGSTQ